jgi:hypothetical protein
MAKSPLAHQVIESSKRSDWLADLSVVMSIHTQVSQYQKNQS